MNSESIFSELKTKRAYFDSKNGYIARYPNSWQIEKDQNGNAVFENPNNPQESLTVFVASLDSEKIIRHSISIKSERDIAKNNLKIALIKADSSKDGAPLDVAIIRSSAKLFYISGHSQTLEVFARNFKVK
ncbi:MAG: hypothetical protein NVSMB66_0680 [Candidatus Doudnabacteria bacterium]